MFGNKVYTLGECYFRLQMFANLASVHCWKMQFCGFYYIWDLINYVQGRQSWGGMGGGDTSPQFLDWGDEYLIVLPIFLICSMKFNGALFSVYCGHCLSLSILLNTIQI